MLQMRQPGRRHDQRKPFAAHRIGELDAVGGRAKADILLHDANTWVDADQCKSSILELPVPRGLGSRLTGAGVALATRGSGDMSAQPAQKRTIVDAQVHLWKAESPDWPW